MLHYIQEITRAAIGDAVDEIPTLHDQEPGQPRGSTWMQSPSDIATSDTHWLFFRLHPLKYSMKSFSFRPLCSANARFSFSNLVVGSTAKQLPCRFSSIILIWTCPGGAAPEFIGTGLHVIGFFDFVVPPVAACIGAEAGLSSIRIPSPKLKSLLMLLRERLRECDGTPLPPGSTFIEFGDGTPEDVLAVSPCISPTGMTASTSTTTPVAGPQVSIGGNASGVPNDGTSMTKLLRSCRGSTLWGLALAPTP
mmetsp:Transcript_39389/g.85721  ORF Transcript_39389/g.85721 Transcript_39389/m.85721 type:complete len:251 (+) Transcript_39389:223-975(+)